MTDTHNHAAFREFEHRGWQRAVSQYHDSWASLTSQVIEPLLDVVGIAHGTRVLDVASGPGYVAAAAKQRGADVVGVDFSSAMVHKARQLYPAIDFEEGDAEELPFPDKSFDAVITNFGMLHFGRPERALAEAYRVLRSPGRVGFTVWAQPEHAKGFGVVLGAIEKHGNLNVSLPPGPPFFRFSDPKECNRVLREAGFVTPTTVQVPQTWRLASPDDLFNAFYWGTARTGPLLHAQSRDVLDVVRIAIIDAAKQYKQNGFINLPMPALLASAVRRQD